MRRGTVTLLLLAGLGLAGCQTLGYYGHVTWGQLKLLGARAPVERVERDLRGSPRAADRALADRLRFSQALLVFAETELALPVGRRYRSYVELDGPYVVWNVFAAPELSLAPHTWCYPVAGCAPYRGYFHARGAERTAARLASRGMDTWVGGVAAYSTLGWFADPLLSSFVGWPEPGFVELVLHELAHGVVWVPGDVAFNESYATFVGTRGAAAWAARGGGSAPPDAAGRLAWARLVDLLARTRTALERIYTSSAPDVVRRAEKARVIEAAQACYAAGRAGLGGGRFDALMASLNNAVLVSIATYEDLVPAFARLYAAQDGDWPSFHAAVRALADLPAAARSAALAELADQHRAEHGDDHDAEQVECEALAHHVAYGEPAGAEDDHVGRGRDR